MPLIYLAYGGIAKILAIIMLHFTPSLAIRIRLADARPDDHH